MKKNNIVVLSLAALLTLTGCGKQDLGDSTTSGGDTSASGVIGSQDVTGFAFNEIASTVMVEDKVKAYVDAMKEQEKTLQYEYRISPLYGPEDFGYQGADKDDNYKSYAPDETGGVDVGEYLSRNDYDGDCPCKPIRISWTKGNLKYGTATVEFWPKGKEDEKRVMTTKSTSVSLENLYRNTEYEYVLKTDAPEWTSEKQTFKTADYTRMINMGGVHNVRDLGGYMTSYGKRTKQGLIYRGYEVMKKAVGSHNANYDDAVQKVQDEVLHIGHEIDLKAAADTDSTTVDGVKMSNLSPAKYSNLQAVAYENFITDTTKYDNMKQTFEILANADKEHVYFHCWGGADRTGMIAFFLNAILGVSYTDLVMDFEYTTLTNNKRSHMHNSSNAHFPKFLHEFTSWSGYEADKTINYNCAKFLKTAAGVSDTTIEKIRSIMIEDYAATLTENENLETYDTSKWESDDNGHWHKSLKAGSLKKGDYHKHQWVRVDEECVVADCNHAGKEVKVCADCGKKVTIDLPQTDHIFVDDGEANGKVHPEIDNGCNTHAYRLDIAEATGWNNATTKWNAKEAPTNEASWDISGGKIPAGKYSVYIDCSMSYSSHSDRYFFNQNKTVNPKNPVTGEDYPDDTASSPDTDTQSKWRYYVSLNDGAAINPDQGKSWGDLGLGTGSNTKYVCLNTEITIGADATKFSAWHGNIGYSLTISHVRLVEVKTA